MTPAERAYEMLKEFHIAYKVKGTPRLRAVLLVEECKELLEAVSKGFENVEDVEAIIKEACDVSYISTGNLVDAEFMDYPIDAIMNALSQHERAVIVAAQAVVESVLEEVLSQEEWIDAFEEVHRSNMSKLDDDGQPIFREDGKVLKGPNYFKPDLRDFAEDVLDELAA